MTLAQIAILALLAAMLAVFSLNRFRLELVALCGLTMGGLLGLVPVENLFNGFASPTVITVLEILLIVQVLDRMRLLEAMGERLGQWTSSERSVTLALCATGAFISVFMNNVGALALMMPLALSVCEKHDIAPRTVLMPLSFATLLGGLCSVIGTPANLIASASIETTRGAPLDFFELGLVGLPLTLAGLAYIYFVTPERRLIRRDGDTPVERHGRPYVSEAAVPATSPLIGLSVDEAGAAHGFTIHNILRAEKFVFGAGKRLIEPGDILVLEAQEHVRDSLMANAVLAAPTQPVDDGVRIEAVILPESIYVGSHIRDLEGFSLLGIAVEGVGITPRRIEGRLDDVRLAIGDILILSGDPDAIAAECAECGLLVLAPRTTPRPERANYFPLAAFAIGIFSSAVFAVPPVIAFGAVVLALALSGSLSLRQGFENLNWPILIMLGAMIPLGQAVADTGAAAMLAQWSTQLIPSIDAFALMCVMLGLAVLITPFVNNPSTVLVLAPIGMEMARQYGLPPEPVIIAIAVGASLDFMTPFGHHNNTIVMGIANYSFTDFLRLGAPLVGICVLVTIAAIGWFF